MNCDEDAFKFRISKSMLVPFYEVPVNLDSIVNIMIGPCCQHPDLSASSVSMLMNKYDLMDISIKNSSIPFRVSQLGVKSGFSHKRGLTFLTLRVASK